MTGILSTGKPIDMGTGMIGIMSTGHSHNKNLCRALRRGGRGYFQFYVSRHSDYQTYPEI
jgi:hypothetical protein